MRKANVSEVVRENPLGTRAIGRTFGFGEEAPSSVGGGAADVGAVVMYFVISKDFWCHPEMIDKNSTNGSFSLISDGMETVEEAPGTSVISVSAAGGRADVPQVLIAHEKSLLLRCSLMKAPTSASNDLSEPSTAMMAPRIS